MRFVERGRAAAGAAAERHARPARPLRRDRHDGPAAGQGRGGDHRARRAQPRRRAGRRAGRATPRADGQLLRRRARAARAVPERRGALRRAGARVRRCRRPSELLALPRRRDRGCDCGCASAEPTTTSLLRAEGPHNAQNACGAAALALTFGLDADDRARRAGARCQPAFGRGQTFNVDGRRVVLQLVKNPAGFRQTLRTLDDGAPEAVVDRDQRRLRRRPGRVVAVGRRLHRARPALPHAALDRRHPGGRHGGAAALRRRRGRRDRAGPGEGGALGGRRGRAGGATVVVFSTYTAMWALHAVLLRIGS